MQSRAGVQDRVQMEISKDGDYSATVGSLCHSPQSEKAFSGVEMEFPGFQVVPQGSPRRWDRCASGSALHGLSCPSAAAPRLGYI